MQKDVESLKNSFLKQNFLAVYLKLRSYYWRRKTSPFFIVCLQLLLINLFSHRTSQHAFGRRHAVPFQEL